MPNAASSPEVSTAIDAVRERIHRACLRSGRRPQEVTIVAVTKNVPPEAILRAFGAGLRHFGENRIQEARDKRPHLSATESAVTWHMVGHLQSNKVRPALQLFDIIESVDSLHLAERIDSQAQAMVPVLLQVNVAGEGSKGGFAPGEVEAAAAQVGRLPRLELKGLMGIAPLVDAAEDARPVFRRLREIRDALGLIELSMGMSHDFEVAIEEGATMVRLGRVIFGERQVR